MHGLDDVGLDVHEESIRYSGDGALERVKEYCSRVLAAA
jgi:hypothetical protein